MNTFCRSWFRRVPLSLRESCGLLLILCGLVVFFSLMTRSFLTPMSLSMLANRVPSLTVVSLGMTFVLIVGGIDLSVGALLGLSGVVLGVALETAGLPYWSAVLAAVLVSTLCGFANGLITVLFRIPSFIVTLGMLEICRGTALLLSESRTQYLGTSVTGLAEPIAGLWVSPSFIIACGMVGIGHLALTRTVWGRMAIAVGTNEQAVRMAGLRDWPIRLLAFSLVGGLSGVAGIFDVARLGAANPNAGTGMELSAIAAVVIGGTSLTGGRGSVVATLLGVLVISILQTGLAQMGVPDPIKQLVTGAVIVVAVITDAWRHRFGSAFSQIIFKRGPQSMNDSTRSEDR